MIRGTARHTAPMVRTARARPRIAGERTTMLTNLSRRALALTVTIVITRSADYAAVTFWLYCTLRIAPPHGGEFKI